jgi:hypothetical protein
MRGTGGLRAVAGLHGDATEGHRSATFRPASRSFTIFRISSSLICSASSVTSLNRKTSFSEAQRTIGDRLKTWSSPDRDSECGPSDPDAHEDDDDGRHYREQVRDQPDPCVLKTGADNVRTGWNSHQ